MKKHFLSIDVGGTNLKSGLIDLTGQLHEQTTVPTVTTDLQAFVQQLQSILDHFAGQYQGVAFSVPGKVAHPSEQISGGGLLSFLDQQSLPQLLHVDEGVVITVENDGKAAALAEMWLGNLQGVANGAAIVLGSGIGSGLVLNHQLFYGQHFQAGEISFMLQNQTATLDNLSGKNCSAVLMIKTIAQQLGLSDLTDGRQVFAAIQAQDTRATTIFRKYCQNVALLLLNMQAVIDVQRFVIGGGISAQPLVTTTIQQELRDLRTQLPIIEQTLAMPEVMTSKLQNDANLYGALYHLLLVTGQVSEH